MSGHQSPDRNRASDQKNEKRAVSRALKVTAVAVRSAFVILLVVLVAHLSAPQNETLWSIYETPEDLIRLLIGFLICCVIAWKLFAPPKDIGAYKTWIYLGLTALPLAIIWTLAIW